MVKIQIINNENDMNISIKGHANYSSKGFDIICSSLSTSIYLMQQLYENFGLGGFFKLEEGDAKIKISVNSFAKRAIFKTFLDFFKNLEDEYPNNVEVEYENTKNFK